MKFKTDENEKTSRTWYNDRYAVTIQKTSGERSDTYVVFVAVSDEKDDQYDPIYPRFEGHGLANMGPVAESVVRELAKLKDDAPLSQVKKVLEVIKDRLHQAYKQMKAEKDPTGYKNLGIDPKRNDKPGTMYYGGK